MISKLFSIYTKIEPLLGKKLPMFSQTIGQFSKSKSNWIGGVLTATGLVMLWYGRDDIGVQVLGLGLGLITIKDAITKK